MIDTHAHINHEKLKECLPQILSDLNDNKLETIICPSYNIKSSQSSLKLSQENEKVFSALAIHPSETNDYSKDFENFLRQNLKNKKVVALGEYGLDYHFEPYDKQMQKEVFLSQLEIAKKENIASIFHVRDAFDDFIPLLKENLNGFCGGVVHCYDSNLENAKKLLDMGLYISFTGIITFKGRDELRDVLKFVPNDRFMLETDSPYLAPVPFRGQVCIPEYVCEVYKMCSSIKGLKMEELEEITRENSKNCFKKLVI